MDLQKLKLSSIRRTQKISESKKNKIKLSILKKGFDYNKGYITVDRKNIIINGNHRYQSLIEIYGKEHEIFVKKTKLSRKTYYLIVCSIIIIVFYFLFNII